eukprot:CAMPEP_0172490076 /NCGR_PEP_ID=MMETSP1066-20121228/20436_1 /TAXON_ID=671091 /ORGANISM="Coscinodiscus wailesii, Strain CCMP2513" /LENGTH=377 /DNA_ID=CAMNT_0013258381 /DNA_START=288 /DNA_END=1421 /DNA_ORIENTATION=+
MTAEKCRCILANAFLGNIGSIPFSNMWERSIPLQMIRWNCQYESVVTEKIFCLLAYFDATKNMSQEDSQRMIVFEKVFFQPQDNDLLPNAKKDKEPFLNLKGWDIPTSPHNSAVVITQSAMEDSACTGFVNFANQMFGYGDFVPSCTQEEIMQMMCPEFNVGMLFFEKMENECVILARNIRRYSKYEGYLDTFRFCGALPDDARYDQTIITMDAVFCNHYSPENQLRDVRKAYLGFSSCLDTVKQGEEEDQQGKCREHIVISTGQWGCGAFGGNPEHKFLQQAIAIGLCGGKVSLRFSSFRDAKLARRLQSLWDFITTNNLTPRQIYEACNNMKETQNFEGALYFLQKHTPDISSSQESTRILENLATNDEEMLRKV